MKLPLQPSPGLVLDPGLVPGRESALGPGSGLALVPDPGSVLGLG